MTGFFSRLFGNQAAPTLTRGPLGLHKQAGFTLDTLMFRLCEDQLQISIPGEMYTVSACGTFDLGAGSAIHRYYTSGDEFLQISTTGGQESENIDDIKLFVYQDSSGISSANAWQDTLSSLGDRQIRWQNATWQRVFNAEEAGRIAAIHAIENVVNAEGECWDVHNFMMAYQRQVSEELFEYLLLTGEETFNDDDEPEWLFSRALGVDIPLTSIKVVG